MVRQGGPDRRRPGSGFEALVRWHPKKDASFRPHCLGLDWNTLVAAGCDGCCQWPPWQNVCQLVRRACVQDVAKLAFFCRTEGETGYLTLGLLA